MNMKFFVAFLLSLCSLPLAAQNVPLGQWQSHATYSNAIGVASDGVTVYAISAENFFTYNAAQEEITGYSKVQGMSDVNMTAIGYDATTGTTILAYQNANIDLFKDNQFYNIPDVKRGAVTGIKQIYQIYTANGMAYLSTSFGVVVLNLTKKETKETYSFVVNNTTIPVMSFVADNTYFFAATNKGLFRANKNNPNLQAFSSWTLVDSNTRINSLAAANGKVFAATTDSLFYYQNGLVFAYKSSMQILHLDPATNGIYISEYKPTAFQGVVKKMEATSIAIVDSFRARGKPMQTVATNSLVWMADAFYGLGKSTDYNTQSFYLPNGPKGVTSYDILPYNKEVYVAHGGYTEGLTYLLNKAGISHLVNDKWVYINNSTIQALDSITDFIALAKDPIDNTLYGASYFAGLFALKTDGTYDYLKQNTILEPATGDAGSYRVSGVTIDLDGNVWITQALAPHELIVKTRDGQYYKYAGAGSQQYAAYVTVDDFNQKWYTMLGTGIAVYDDNHTPHNRNDDRYTKVTTGQNLPSNLCFCIVKDKDGALWVGTDNGIGIINCPDQMIDGNCPVEKRIVQYDQFAGFLFQNERVKTIAIDGANRKWIGTGNGVWLISASGDKIIERFTDQNSPLPSNNIQKIAIDPVTGDVYIGTAAGLVAYRGTATDGGTSNSDIVTFPNPVPSGYTGTIAIKGLVANADVRITDISGQLIYRTKALGGQAVWNGRDYKGRRPQSGVYLIFVSSKDGTQKTTSKMVFME